MKKLLMFVMVSSFFSSFTFGQDLAIQSLTLSSYPVVRGSVVYPKLVIANIGDKIANASTVGFYLSTDSVFGSQAQFLSAAPFPALATGGEDTLTGYIQLSDSLLLNRYFLFAVVDYKNVVPESNEKNNAAFKAISFSQPTVDLTITSFSPHSATYTVGGEFTGYIAEANAGNSPSAEHTMEFYLSTDSSISSEDIMLDSTWLGNLQGGSYLSYYPSFYLPNTITTGVYYVIAVTDANFSNVETNENNNTSSVKINVGAQSVNLTASGLYIYPPHVSQAQYIHPNSFISNSGSTPVGNASVAYYLSKDSTVSYDDILLANNYLGYIEKGTTVADSIGLFIPTGISNGTYFLLSVVDSKNLIEESNENDNVKYAVLYISDPSVDLTLPYVYLPSKVAPGTFITPSAYVYNNGNSTAAYHQTAFFLSKDTVYSPDDVRIGTDSVLSLAAENYAILNPQLYIPTTTSYGQYYVLTVVDYTSYVQETNEGNNVHVSPISIEAASIDLSISSNGPDTLHGTQGSNIYPNFIEYNTGTLYAPFHFVGLFLSTDAVYDSSDTFLNSQYSSIYPGGNLPVSVSALIPSNLPAGHYYLIAVADYSSTIAETDENNNTKAVHLVVEPSSIDLRSTILYVDSLAISAGSYIYVYSEDSNIGSTYAPNHSIGYYLSKDTLLDNGDVMMGSEYAPGLIPSGSNYFYSLLHIPTSIQEGQYYVLARTDNSLLLTETNESNNTSYYKLEVRPSVVDLTISKLTLENTTVNPGSYVVSSAIDKNLGSSYAGPHTISFYLSKDSTLDNTDLVLTYDSVPALYGGSEYNTYPWLYIPEYISAGEYYIIAQTDVYDKIVEYNEYNNYRAARFTVGIKGTDLTIPSLTVTNYNPSAGSFLYATLTESNQGNVATSGHHIGYVLSTDAYFDENDLYLSTNYLSGLNANSSKILNPALYIPGTVADGYYYLIAMADYGNNVYETIESNNTHAIQITIGNPVSASVDLTFTYFLTDNSVAAGSNLYTKFYEVNNGTIAAGYHTINYYLSQDTTISVDDINLGGLPVYKLNAGETNYGAQFVYIPSYVTPGSYQVIVKVDSDNNIAEFNEYNNLAFRNIQVTAGEVILGLGAAQTLDKISLYPNPTQGVVYFTNIQNVDDIEIVDLNGQTVARAKAGSLNGNALNLESLGSGVYFVKTMKEGTVTSNQKVVINK